MEYITKILELHAIHEKDIEFYRSLLKDQLTISSKSGEWYVTVEGFYKLDAEQHTIMLLRDPDFVDFQQQLDDMDQDERQQRLDRIQAWQTKRKLRKHLKTEYKT